MHDARPRRPKPAPAFASRAVLCCSGPRSSGAWVCSAAGGLVMADLASVLSSVHDQLEVLANRRGELQAQLAEVDREHGRLAAAISVMEEHLKKRPGSSATDRVAAPGRLADQIFDELCGLAGQDPCRFAARLSAARCQREHLRVGAWPLCASVVPSSSAVGTSAGWLRGHPRVRLLRPRTSLPPAQTLIGALPMSILSPLRSIMQSLVLRDPVRSWTLAFRLQLRFRFDRCPVGPLFRSGFGMRRRPRPLVPALRWSSFCPQGVTASSVSTAIAGLKRRGVLDSVQITSWLFYRVRTLHLHRWALRRVVREV